MLGDDIVIYHPEIAREYARLIKILGVEVSLPKT